MCEYFLRLYYIIFGVCKYVSIYIYVCMNEYSNIKFFVFAVCNFKSSNVVGGEFNL